MPPSLLPEEGRKEGRQAGPPLHGRGGSALLLTVEQAGAVAVPGYLQPRVLLHSPGTRPRGWGGGKGKPRESIAAAIRCSAVDSGAGRRGRRERRRCRARAEPRPP